MKVKIRFKVDRGSTSAISGAHRVIVGELKSFPADENIPEDVKNNFFLIEGKNFFLEKHKEIAETAEEEPVKMFLVPISEVRLIRVLPDDFDIMHMEYQIVGSRLICKTTKTEVSLKDEEK